MRAVRCESEMRHVVSKVLWCVDGFELCALLHRGKNARYLVAIRQGKQWLLASIEALLVKVGPSRPTLARCPAETPQRQY